MDQDKQSSATRKVKYAPKPQTRRKPRTIVPKTEAEDEEDEEAARNRSLLRRFSAEFEEAMDLEYDENTINPASDLGLLEETDKERMYFFQFPNNLPLVKQSASSTGKEKVGSSISTAGASEKGFSLEDFSEGYMGKMLIYKSGAVKLKLGDILYDVSPGSDCIFAQDVAAINIADKDCCILGELGKRAVVSPGC